ncbi:hypothetical protein EV175_001629 [Coemansia sp. RSA 1933]|nr:hypothetical protein EV175_001629 [Coemansia sp. RSA 1933]
MVPHNDNPTYDTYWPTSAVACISGFAAIFLINLAGLRVIFVIHSLISVIYAGSIVYGYQHESYTFHKVMYVINSASYDITQVAALVVMLTYASERWKARALGIYLFIDYISLTMGDVVAITHKKDSWIHRYHTSIALLVLTCFAPFVAAAIAPAETIVRNNGVYVVVRKTDLYTEIVETVKIFKSKYMLLLLPYMFSYPFAYSTCAVLLNDVVTVILYDLGKIFVILLGLMLDIPWSTRRMRAYVGFANLCLFFTLSIIFTMLTRMYNDSWKLANPKTSENQLSVIFETDSVERNLAYTALFFTGIASSLIELFGLWVIGTLTNDMHAACRFVGTFNSVMFIGGMLGIQIAHHVPFTFLGANLPMIIGNAATFASFVCMYLVIRRITDTNDWSLGRIPTANDSHVDFDGAASDQTSETYIVVTDVKYRHEQPTV